jgi:gentisate 1,2-dioxygenase
MTIDHENDILSTTAEVDYDQLDAMLIDKDLRPLWKETKRLNTPSPMPKTLPWLWRWAAISPLAEAAGRVVTIDRGGDRRVLALTNPGLSDRPFATSTLWGAIQYLGPQESAPAHRHSASAIRFVTEGNGVYTTVNGDAVDMGAGDLILTPAWHWHDHMNASDGSMTWFDGLDLPMVVALDSVFFELHDRPQQEVRSRNGSEALYGSNLRVASTNQPGSEYSPLFRYPWSETNALLERATPQAEDSWVRVRYTNPLNGRDIMPTMGAEAVRVLPGGRTRTRREVGNRIYVVYQGTGTTVINGTVFEWKKGDVFVAPSWASVDHQVSEQSDLFVLTDRPALERLHLYAEEVCELQQEITGRFDSTVPAEK